MKGSWIERTLGEAGVRENGPGGRRRRSVAEFVIEGGWKCRCGRVEGVREGGVAEGRWCVCGLRMEKVEGIGKNDPQIHADGRRFLGRGT